MRITPRLAGALLLSLTGSLSFAYEVAEVSNGGGLTGTVRLGGSLPKPETTIIGKDNHVCGDGNAVMNPVRVAADQGLADAVVVIEGIRAGKAWSDAAAPKIVQKDCEFGPYVQTAEKGAEMTIVNEDPLLHNIHTYEIIGRARRTLFNIAQPRAGQIDTHVLKMRRGSVVEVACDAHNWMSAWVYTAEHPYVTVTDAEGRFEIGDVPPGRYTVRVWHPTLGERTSEIEIEAGATAAFDVSLDGAKA